MLKMDLWASVKTVEEYQESDFLDQPPLTQEELLEAIEAFRSFAETVSSNAPLSDEKRREGTERFEKLAAVVGGIVRDEWIRSVDTVMTEVQEWCSQLGWTHRHIPKDIFERLLGSYEMESLLFYAEGDQFELSPAARFVPGSLGMIEFRVLPSYNAIKINRFDSGWRVRRDDGKEAVSATVRDWNKQEFEESVRWLRQYR